MRELALIELFQQDFFKVLDELILLVQDIEGRKQRLAVVSNQRKSVTSEVTTFTKITDNLGDIVNVDQVRDLLVVQHVKHFHFHETLRLVCPVSITLVSLQGSILVWSGHCEASNGPLQFHVGARFLLGLVAEDDLVEAELVEGAVGALKRAYRI